MRIEMSTPALLFPALSLLLLAYTNRFLALAALIRTLHEKHCTDPDPTIAGQIDNLRRRIILIRNMQALGILSLLCAVISMLLLFADYVFVAELVFAAGLVLMLASLWLSFREIRISVAALDLRLTDCANTIRKKKKGK